MHDYCSFSDLTGKTIVSIDGLDSDCVVITTECGTRTTFTLSTGDNSLILVWEGYSNGYYGEGVSFYERDGSGSRW